MLVGPGWHCVALTPLSRCDKLKAVTFGYNAALLSPSKSSEQFSMDLAQFKTSLAGLSKLDKLSITLNLWLPEVMSRSLYSSAGLTNRKHHYDRYRA